MIGHQMAFSSFRTLIATLTYINEEAFLQKKKSKSRKQNSQLWKLWLFPKLTFIVSTPTFPGELPLDEPHTFKQVNEFPLPWSARRLLFGYK